MLPQAHKKPLGNLIPLVIRFFLQNNSQRLDLVSSSTKFVKLKLFSLPKASSRNANEQKTVQLFFLSVSEKLDKKFLPSI